MVNVERMRCEEPVALFNAAAFASGVTGTVVHPLGDETEVDPPGVIGTVVHPPGNGTEVDPPAAGVAIQLLRAWSAADQEPLAAAGANALLTVERSPAAAISGQARTQEVHG